MLELREPDTIACEGLGNLGRNHADSLKTRVATMVSGFGDRAASTYAAIIGSNEGQSPRLLLEMSPSGENVEGLFCFTAFFPRPAEFKLLRPEMGYFCAFAATCVGLYSFDGSKIVGLIVSPPAACYTPSAMPILGSIEFLCMDVSSTRNTKPCNQNS